MGLQIVGTAIATLEPIERNKIARGLDYVGYVPGLGSVGGLVRVIGAIAALIFCSIKASQAQGQDKEKLLIWVCISKDEAARGLLEITWIFNVIISAQVDCVIDDQTYPYDHEHRYQEPTDQEYTIAQTRYQPIKGIIPVESCWLDLARGNFIYKDTSDRSGGIHYSHYDFSNLQVIWSSDICRRAFYGTRGIVLKEGYEAKPHPTEAATYTVDKQTTKPES